MTKAVLRRSALSVLLKIKKIFGRVWSDRRWSGGAERRREK